MIVVKVYVANVKNRVLTPGRFARGFDYTGNSYKFTINLNFV